MSFIDLTGIKFTKLTPISYSKGSWYCECDCGNFKDVKAYNLRNKNTRSCGCLRVESFKNRKIKLSDYRKKYEPRIASARRAWKNTYCYRDANCVNFEIFLEKSQMNCFYCGCKPKNKYNQFAKESARGSLIAKKEGLFIYNGLDRIDSSKDHTEDNIVSCCYNCNRAKSNRSNEDFLNWVNHLEVNHFKRINIKLIKLPTNGSLLTSVKCVFYNHRKDTDLTLQEYYSLSQMKCFYCNGERLNKFNKAKTDKKSSQQLIDNGDYIYNGIDRVDINLLHTKDNVVPCCKWCNFAKSGMSLNDFNTWISEIKQYQNKKARSFDLAF